MPRTIDTGIELECVVFETGTETENPAKRNFYNPFRELELSRLEEGEGIKTGSMVVW